MKNVLGRFGPKFFVRWVGWASAAPSALDIFYYIFSMELPLIVALLFSFYLVSLQGSLVRPTHPFIQALNRENRREPVRYGSLSVEIEEGDVNLHHHRRQLGSLIHETLQIRLIYLPEQWPHAEEGEIIEFELFDGVIALGRTEALEYRSEDSVGWNGDIRISTGNIEEDLKTSDGYFGLSCFEKACVANIKIYSTDQEFNIAPSGIPLGDRGEGIYAISEIYLENSKRTGVTSAHFIHSNHTSTSANPLHHSMNSMLRGNLRGRDSPVNVEAVDTDNIVDILVLYTPQAVSNYAGGR
jgi:hypothetical protein